jgi:hypothetical protein
MTYTVPAVTITSGDFVVRRGSVTVETNPAPTLTPSAIGMPFWGRNVNTFKPLLGWLGTATKCLRTERQGPKYWLWRWLHPH